MTYAVTHQYTFTNALLFATQALETDEGAANKAECRVFWHLFAGSAGLPVIVLEDDVVVVRELQKARGCPLRILDKHGLQETGGQTWTVEMNSFGQLYTIR